LFDDAVTQDSKYGLTEVSQGLARIFKCRHRHGVSSSISGSISSLLLKLNSAAGCKKQLAMEMAPLPCLVNDSRQVLSQQQQQQRWHVTVRAAAAAMWLLCFRLPQLHSHWLASVKQRLLHTCLLLDAHDCSAHLLQRALKAKQNHNSCSSSECGNMRLSSAVLGLELQTRQQAV
jgi:hypothetical protein